MVMQQSTKTGLSYGLTVDGVTRQTLEYDALSRRTKEVVTSGGSKRENLYVFGTINHLLQIPTVCLDLCQMELTAGIIPMIMQEISRQSHQEKNASAISMMS